ncbi:MAG: hypothetical protein HOL85_17130 [Rhodospirillaceae bacterium]|nr:hypothetical protein [Rhodospirillaceae bacterium]MBT6136133.1 hypothetical protein [Rhodospirillaceae bacterium]
MAETATENVDRRALGLFSDTVTAHLGPNDRVSREVRRAYLTGREIDRFMARAAFDALPGWERGRIGSAANDRAQRTVRDALRGTARDWTDLERFDEPSSTARAKDLRGGGARGGRNAKPKPPKFLSRRPES